MSEQKDTKFVVKMPDGINFNQPICDINGDPIISDDGEVLQLGDVCINALLSSLQDDKSDGTQKLKRFNLAQKLKSSSVEDDYHTLRLNSKNKTMIMDMAAKAFGVLVYGRMHEALEGTTDTDDE
jgi:hypothetical protein